MVGGRIIMDDNNEKVDVNDDIDSIKSEMKHMIDEDVKRFVGQELTISSDK